MRGKTGYIIQDVGLLLLFVDLCIICLVMCYADSILRNEFTVLLLVTFTGIMFMGFSLSSLAVVWVGMEIIVYSSYKIFQALTNGININSLCYAWLFMPVIGMLAVKMFVYGKEKTEKENEMLREQVERLVLIDPLTDLYNLRSMYGDLRRQIAYADRNNVKFSLMIIKLRYETELRNILPSNAYNSMIQRMADIIVNSVRMEDKVYSIDNRGSIGIILNCAAENCRVVEGRIRSKIQNKDAFAKIVDRSINVEIKIAKLEYDKELFGNDIIGFKERVESELQYDV